MIVLYVYFVLQFTKTIEFLDKIYLFFFHCVIIWSFSFDVFQIQCSMLAFAHRYREYLLVLEVRFSSFFLYVIVFPLTPKYYLDYYS